MTEELHEKKKEEFTIKIKKDDFWKYSTFILLAIVIIGGFVFFTSDNVPKVTGEVTGGNQPAPTNPGPTEPSVVTASVDDVAVLGSKSAAVTIIEFSDYECPFCGRHFTQTYPSIKQEYVDTGKVKIIFRDFPLTSIHPNAQKAAEAAECVGEQAGDEGYYKMHDKLYTNQQSLSITNYKSWAREISGVDGAKFDNCLDSGKYASEVQKDSQDAQTAGGRGTPYFVVMDKSGKGTAISGAQPFSAFKSAIDAALAA